MTGPSSISFPVTSPNQSALFTLGYNIAHVPGTTLAPIDGSLFRDDFWKINNGWWESPATDLGTVLEGYLQPSITKVVEHHGAVGTDFAQVSGEYLAEYTMDDINNNRALLSAKLFITTDNPAAANWVEAAPGQKVTCRYVKLVIQALDVGPLTRVRVTSAGISLDVDDKTKAASVVVNSTSQFVPLPGFKALGSAVLTPDVACTLSTQYATGAVFEANPGFTISSSGVSSYPITVNYNVKGY